ncbi:Sorbose reductase SOU1 [Penicillium brasilianum]|uniref:Sorbose reductase SOU1 n=1 Tax=Penicillium brasilianum TaxID=104259 RepID=A0A1S9RRA2_PENBI|nr:Sorbose reductase SOU1 [Penicillium brasilianum]
MSMSIEDSATGRDGFPRPFPNTPSNVLEQFRLDGKVVVVNGAADGIGLAVAQAMAEAGANVVLWYNSNEAAIQKSHELADQHKIKSAAYKVDGKPTSIFEAKVASNSLFGVVSESTQVSKAMEKVVEDFGKIDVFVANAGMAISKPILEQTLSEYHKQMSVNVDGIVYCAKYAGHVFQRQGFGNLIITSSMSAHIVNVPVDQPVYNGTKAFVTHFGKSLAREWRDFARVNIVSPGFFDTKMGASPLCLNEAYRMSSLGRQGHVKEIKGLYLYLASDASTYMTGSDVLIDGGYVLP